VDYQERLKILGLTYFRNKKVETGLNRRFKILKGYENIDQEVFLICHSPALAVVH